MGVGTFGGGVSVLQQSSTGADKDYLFWVTWGFCWLKYEWLGKVWLVSCIYISDHLTDKSDLPSPSSQEASNQQTTVRV